MKLRYLAGAAATALLVQSAANAQDFKQGAPQQMPTEKPTAVPPPLPQASTDATVVSEGLKGLVFVPGSRFLSGYKLEPVTGVAVVRLNKGEDGVDLDVLDTAEFKALANGLLGKRLTVADLERFSRDVIEFYRLRGHPLVDVRIPARQDDPATTGTLIVTVTEFRVGTVDVKGVDVESGTAVLTPAPKYFSAKIIRAGLRLKRGSRIQERRIVEDLDYLSNNPFRRVDLIYRKSADVGYTDLTMRVAERRPFRAYVGYENTGTVATQRDRYSAGFNWGNVLGWDHQLSYQFTASENLFSSRPGNPDPSFVSHSATYLIPLGSGVPLNDSLLIFGTYQRTSPTVAPAFNQVGKSYQLSGRYILQLPAPDNGKQQLSFGYDFKRTNNNLLFGGTLISATATEIHQAVIEYSGERSWRIGGIKGRSEAADLTGTRITLRVGDTVVISPGGIGSRNTTPVFTASGTPFAESNYLYNRLTVAPSVLFENGVEARGRVMWQIANGNLLPTEQLASAGPSYVRGYDPSAALGSNGLLASAELMAPAFAIPTGNARLRSQARGGVFLDYGRVSDPDRLAGAISHVTTSSAGFTGTFALGRYLSARLDYGWQLTRLPGATKRGDLGYVSVTLGF